MRSKKCYGQAKERLRMSKENEKKDFCPESKTMLRHFGEKPTAGKLVKKLIRLLKMPRLIPMV